MKLECVVSVLLCLLGLTVLNAFALTPDVFLYRNTRPDGTGTPYRLFVPPSDRSGQAWPLIVFLNGSGEIGNDNSAQLRENTTSLFRVFLSDAHLAQQPVVFAVPQSRWTVWDPAAIAEVVASIQLEAPIDKDRIYLTGLSSGGSAVWSTLKAFPGLFAAGVPVCAATTPAGIKAIASTPVWIFHGMFDHEIDPRYGNRGERLGPRRIVRMLRSFGGKPLYTEYAHLGHMVWDRAYAEPRLFRWLVTQRRHAVANPTQRTARAR